MAYLFLVTVGPVQEFIASARRTRDLWFGSWLLSELSRTVAQSLQRDGGDVTLIFPPENSIQSADQVLANVANKILATVSADPEVLGTHVVQKVKERLTSIWTDAHRQFTGEIDEDMALQQIQDLIEVYWAAYEFAPEKYAVARKHVGALMAARKVTRDFAPVTWGAQTPKSSIDGQRESVIAEAVYPQQGELPEQIRVKKENLYRQYRAGPAERLSGVDMLKRHGQASETARYFPSTSDVAVRPLLARLIGANKSIEREKAFKAWETYLTEVENLAAGRLREERVAHYHPVIGNYDGGLLLESRLFELFDDRNDREQANRALAGFFKALELPRPEPYYAILIADGDRMGATIDHQQTIERHLQLSHQLGLFAANAQQTIENDHNGALIYAGGDDVLAFVPLHTLLDCARALHRTFASTINPGKSDVFTDAHTNRPTLSVGIAICHHLEPLSDALTLARNAEQAAKRVDGKDALAITLSKRSGADVMIAGKWGELDIDLAAFVAMHRIDTLPDGAAFQLRDLAERLTPKRAEPTLPAKATIGEAKRVIGRKQPKHSVSEAVATTTRTKLYTALERSATPTSALDDEDAERADRKRALDQVRAVANALIVARALAVAEDIADLPLTEEG